MFLGLAFEEIYKRDDATIPGGIRTYPLIALAGAMLYLIDPRHAFAFAASVLAIAGWLFSRFQINQASAAGSRRTLVVPVANLLAYALGPITFAQPPWLAVAVTVAAVLVIGTREEMHCLARVVPRDKLLTAGKFPILAEIILPLVPDTRFVAHTMTKRQGKTGTIDVKTVLAGDEEFLWALVRTALQEVLEAEMTEALGAEKGERTAGRQA